MSSQRHLYILVALMTLIGLWLFVYKAKVLDLPLGPYGQSTAWTVEAKINFQAEAGRSVKVEFFVPPSQSGFQRIDENFVSRNYGVTTNRDGDNRLSTWTLRSAPQSSQTLYYRAFFYQDANFQGPEVSNRSISGRANFEGAELAAEQTIVSNARQQSVDSLSFAVNVVQALNNTADGNAAILLDRDYSSENIAKTAAYLLKGPSEAQGPNIVARLIYGFELESQQNRQNVPMQIYLGIWDVDNAWRYIDPNNGRVGLPDDFLIWEYGNGPLLNIEGGSNSNVTFSFNKRQVSSLSIAQEAAVQSRSMLITYSLFNLPLQTQEVYQILLMIPLGALVILILRQMIGIRTFGTFMPVLIALAFRETQLFYGILLFVFITSLGLAVRFYLEHLKLLLIPRLSAVLATVVILMMLMSVFSNQLGLQLGLSVALFPMVILTMTIERMSIVWEERNAWEAIRQGIGSLVAASLAYLVMSNLYLEHLMFVFPELILIIMAIMLIMGRYQGYRLTELLRFKDLISKP